MSTSTPPRGWPQGLFIQSLQLPSTFGTTYSDPEEYPNPNEEMAVQETTVAKPDIDTDIESISRAIFNSMANRVPGWIPRDGNLDTWLIEDFSAVAATIRQEAITVPEAIFVTYGEEVLGIPIPVPEPASGWSNWTAIDSLGYTIPVGTQFSMQISGDENAVFETTAAASILPGQLEVKDVPFRASDEGAQGNDLWGAADPVDPLAWVDTIDVPNPTMGGSNGMTVAEYLDRLVILMRMIALRPVLPWDYAILALGIPGVARAIAMDGYDPPTNTWFHQRQITLIVADVNGQPCSQPVKDMVKLMLETLREVNVTVWVIDPIYYPVDVAYEVTIFAEQDPVMVQDLCDAAIRAELSPALYRLGVTSNAIQGGEVIPPPYPTPTTPPGRQTIHLGDVVGLLDRQRGVDWVTIPNVTFGTKLPQPFPPIPSFTVTGGTLPDGFYTCAVSYVDAVGETTASTTMMIRIVNGNNTAALTIPSPPAVPGATGWNAYVSQPGVQAVTLQNAAPIAIGTDMVLTAPPTNTGAGPPAANTTATTTTNGDVLMTNEYTLPQVGTVTGTILTQS